MTYEKLCSFEVLYKAYLEARKGKRSKSKTIEYEAQALACTEKLSRKLAVRDVRQPGGDIRQQICYVPSKFEVFAVYEPKRRMVHAPAFVDKVVLHALVDNILYDALTRSFYPGQPRQPDRKRHRRRPDAPENPHGGLLPP